MNNIEKEYGIFNQIKELFTNKKFEECQRVITENNFDVNYVDGILLHWAMYFKSAEMANFLFDNGMEISDSLNEKYFKELVLVATKKLLEVDPIKVIEKIKSYTEPEYVELYKEIQSGKYFDKSEE